MSKQIQEPKMLDLTPYLNKFLSEPKVISLQLNKKEKRLVASFFEWIRVTMFNDLLVSHEKAMRVIEVYEKALEKTKNIVIENECDECGTFSGIRYEIKPNIEALTAGRKIMEGE